MTESKNINSFETEKTDQTVSVTRALQQHLRSLAVSGVATLPCSRGQVDFELTQQSPPTSPSCDAPIREKAPLAPGVNLQPSAKPPALQVREPAPVPPINPDRYGVRLDTAAGSAELKVIQAQVQACTRCPELVENRTQTVFGVGCETPRLVFIGEGPGADEDRIGEPFVGAAGKLLDKIMAASKLQRSEVYILNTVKCRPPGNRNPSTNELSHCWEYTERQLDVLQPAFICCLGSVAAKRVLNTAEPLGKLRGKFHRYRGSRVLVTYHPAYLLRTESAKIHVWEDMKLLMKEMGIDWTK